MAAVRAAVAAWLRAGELSLDPTAARQRRRHRLADAVRGEATLQAERGLAPRVGSPPRHGWGGRLRPIADVALVARETERRAASKTWARARGVGRVPCWRGEVGRVATARDRSAPWMALDLMYGSQRAKDGLTVFSIDNNPGKSILRFVTHNGRVVVNGRIYGAQRVLQHEGSTNEILKGILELLAHGAKY